MSEGKVFTTYLPESGRNDGFVKIERETYDGYDTYSLFIPISLLEELVNDLLSIQAEIKEMNDGIGNKESDH